MTHLGVPCTTGNGQPTSHLKPDVSAYPEGSGGPWGVPPEPLNFCAVAHAYHRAQRAQPAVKLSG